MQVYLRLEASVHHLWYHFSGKNFLKTIDFNAGNVINAEVDIAKVRVGSDNTWS